MAGYLDLVASIALPLAYLLFILIYLLEFDSASTIQRSIFRNALSRSIPAQFPLDGRGQLQGDALRPRVAARRHDVEVLLPEGPGTGVTSIN